MQEYTYTQKDISERLLLTVDQAADLLGIGRTFAYHLISVGQWPTVKLGRLRRIRRSDLEVWLDTQTDGAE